MTEFTDDGELTQNWSELEGVGKSTTSRLEESSSRLSEGGAELQKKYQHLMTQWENKSEQGGLAREFRTFGNRGDKIVICVNPLIETDEITNETTLSYLGLTHRGFCRVEFKLHGIERRDYRSDDMYDQSMKNRMRILNDISSPFSPAGYDAFSNYEGQRFHSLLREPNEKTRQSTAKSESNGVRLNLASRGRDYNYKAECIAKLIDTKEGLRMYREIEHRVELEIEKEEIRRAAKIKANEAAHYGIDELLDEPVSKRKRTI